MYPLPVMAAPGAARFLQTAVSRSYRQDDRKTNEKIGGICSSVPYLMARLLNRLLLIALAKGKLPMNEYAVVKEQAKGEVQKELLSPIVQKPWGCQPCSAKNFFNFSMARFRDLATA